jgi:hypothetical protein
MGTDGAGCGGWQPQLRRLLCDSFGRTSEAKLPIRVCITEESEVCILCSTYLTCHRPLVSQYMTQIIHSVTSDLRYCQVHASRWHRSLSKYLSPSRTLGTASRPLSTMYPSPLP